MQRMRGSYYFDEIEARVFKGIGINKYGNVWYVDSAKGTTGKSGKSWSQAKATIAQAVALATAGDVIAIRGSFNEAVTCSLVGVSFVGFGTGPDQAIWTAPTVAGSWCLKLAAANCLVANIKFRPVIYVTSGIPSAILLSGAPYTRIIGCRFQGRTGSYAAIYSPVCDSDNVEIDGNEFIYLNTATHGIAIFGVEAAGWAYSGWKITNNIFDSCVADINIAGRNCLLEGNKHFINGLRADGTFGSAVTGQAIDLSGDDTGANVMTRCTLCGTYNLATYKPGATGDQWRGNFASIVAEKAPAGLTVLVPAA